jgi:drug/metabolite transporter (DMT)-like permease
MSWLVFHQPPSLATIIGGGLIVAGGIVLGAANACWKSYFRATQSRSEKITIGTSASSA